MQRIGDFVYPINRYTFLFISFSIAFGFSYHLSHGQGHYRSRDTDS